MLRIDISPKFRAKEAARPRAAAAAPASEVVFATRARARRDARRRKAAGLLAVLVAPWLAFKAAPRAMRAPAGAPAPASAVVAAHPAPPAPVRMAAKPAPDAPVTHGGIDFTATSATCAAPEKGGECRAAPRKAKRQASPKKPGRAPAR